MNDKVLELFNIWIDEVIVFILLILSLGWLGTKIVQWILPDKELGSAISATFHNGKKIGVLERVIIFIGIIIQEWTLIAIVIALKTIARYSALNEQHKSEYFLIGTMASILWTILIGLAFTFLLNNTEYLEKIKFLNEDKIITIKISEQ